MAKAKKQPYSAEFDGRVLVLSQGPKGEKEVVRKYDGHDVPADLHEKVWQLGFKTKVMNYKSGAKDKGRDPLEMMDEGFERLCDGDWAKEREGGGPTVSPEVEALAQIRKTEVGVIQKSLRQYDMETRKKILSNAEVVRIAAGIRKARESTQVIDLDDMAE